MTLNIIYVLKIFILWTRSLCLSLLFFSVHVFRRTSKINYTENETATRVQKIIDTKKIIYNVSFRYTRWPYYTHTYIYISQYNNTYYIMILYVTRIMYLRRVRGAWKRRFEFEWLNPQLYDIIIMPYHMKYTTWIDSWNSAHIYARCIQ